MSYQSPLPFNLPIPTILCQTFRMRNLTATICLTIAVLLGSAGVSLSADIENPRIDFVASCKNTHTKINRSDGSVGNAKLDHVQLIVTLKNKILTTKYPARIAEKWNYQDGFKSGKRGNSVTLILFIPQKKIHPPTMTASIIIEEKRQNNIWFLKSISSVGHDGRAFTRASFYKCLFQK
jgi:hypothetical protein